ncbi:MULTISPECIES: hypothetical protein [Halomonadaceae]|uniref:Uncharacterized protein n=1 Tax=Vreelandella titanicae TaxID=664683 RepID=A0A1G8NT86_9GAMM|nr:MULTISPECIES: hypothetical protein [Halomonas]QKS24388.1 hypothetical protein FX987_02165 [Halomonas titanicae]QNU60686.1 hypothetical protein HZS52_12835 [Halomonas titanicae]CDG54363.1 exported hypothetical protein [Halomonas sp. A3H3]SDI83156.1 hypothetical protein SAMN04487867_11522 [Halomonas titanicae]|tara:strand:+ start:797 stop:1288 length:492 start_codon:yes stop_codon:yes gene_type:complete
MNSFVMSTLSTVVGGIALALLFFIIKEKLFPLIEISDHWELTTTTQKTKRNPFKNMKIKYDLILWREDKVIRGTAEKFFEISQTGHKTYYGKNRKRGRIEGYIEKNYFSKDRIIINMTLADFGRESDYLFMLTVKNKNLAQGRFYSMVAEQHGHVELTRKGEA